MGHFAQLDENNVVTQVIVVSNDDTSDSNGTETESIGVAFCQKLLGADTNWKQTSYNNNMRGNYAGIGYTYMSNVATLGVGSTDIFIVSNLMLLGLLVLILHNGIHQQILVMHLL